MKMSVINESLTARRRPPRKRAIPQKTAPSYDPVAVMDRGIIRIRIARETDKADVQLSGEDAVKVTTTYLDGTQEVTVSTTKRGQIVKDVKTLPVSALPVRTQNIVDFGRLDAAATQLIGIMRQFDDDNPATPEQIEALVNSYQNLLQWQIQAREKLLRADSAIDLVQQRLTDLLA